MLRERTYGDWCILDRIGSGDDSVVYRCKATNGIEAAIKVSRRNRRRRRDRMIRFSNEVRFLISHGRRPGILPLLDYMLPDDPNEPSWYVMPVAIPFRKALGVTSEFVHVVEAIAHITRTFAELATEGISHQDITPNNLFRFNKKWVAGDFGYVKYPEQDLAVRCIQDFRRPGYFIAPEVPRKTDIASAEQADVYSLAKTLWAVAVGRGHPPRGELRRDRAKLQLSSYVEHRRACLLEPLLECCTADNPLARPTLHEIAEELSLWNELNGTWIR